MRLMAIDPGLQGTGVAIWNSTSHVPIHCDVLNGPKGVDWIRRVDTIAVQVSRLVQQYQVDGIVCEMMEFHGTAKSAMSWHGDLQRTLILIGTIYGMTRIRCPFFRLTPPSEWKGQLPKSVTIRRVRRAIGREACRKLAITTHAWDAVGIGLWHKKVIK